MNAEALLALYERVVDAPDAIARLRRSVLDLAVRGKLVQQDPTEEPADLLFARIKAEKSAAHLHGKTKRPTDPEPVDLDSQPFAIPKSWRWVRLLDICTKLTDGTHHSPPNTDAGDFLYITAKNIRKGGITLDNVTYVSREVHAEIYARCNPEYGDILYIKDGATTGIATINTLREQFSMLSSVALLKIPSVMFNRLVVEFLSSPFFYDQMREKMKGAAITRVTLKRMAPALIPLPPLAEQHRIVAKVDELMVLLDQLEAARSARKTTRDRLTTATLARLTAPDTDAQALTTHARFALEVLPSLTKSADQIKDLRQTVLSLAVRGKLVPQDPKDEHASGLLSRVAAIREQAPPSGRSSRKRRVETSISDLGFDLPSGWEQAPLSEILRVLNGRAYKRSELLDRGKTPVLRVGNLFTSDHWYHSDLELDADKYCDADDLIYAWSASFGPFIWEGPRVIYHYHIWKLDLFSTANVDKRYLYLYLLHKTREIKESGHGISMVHMTKEKMERLAVPLPPLAEQHRIVAKVDELMSLCDSLEAALTNADTNRTRLLEALLHEALHGTATTQLEAAA